MNVATTLRRLRIVLLLACASHALALPPPLPPGHSRLRLVEVQNVGRGLYRLAFLFENRTKRGGSVSVWTDLPPEVELVNAEPPLCDEWTMEKIVGRRVILSGKCLQAYGKIRFVFLFRLSGTKARLHFRGYSYAFHEMSERDNEVDVTLPPAP